MGKYFKYRLEQKQKNNKDILFYYVFNLDYKSVLNGFPCELMYIRFITTGMPGGYEPSPNRHLMISDPPLLRPNCSVEVQQRGEQDEN